MRRWPVQGEDIDEVDLTASGRRTALAGGGLLLSLLAVLGFVAFVGGDREERLAVEGRSLSATSTTAPDPTDTTVPLVPLTTGVPVPDAVERPPPTTAPTARPAPARGVAAAPLAGGAAPSAGSELSGSGSVLRAPKNAVPARKIDKAKGCHSAGDKGWQVEACGALRTSGTVALWVVEKKGKATKVLVLRESRPEEWSVALSATDPDGRHFARVAARGADVTGDGQPELAFGFRRPGGDRLLSLDVVEITAMATSVTLHRDLPSGSAQLGPGEVVTWAAAGDGGAQRDTMRLEGSRWRVVASERVERSAVPPSMV